jgi:hypothetical protein
MRVARAVSALLYNRGMRTGALSFVTLLFSTALAVGCTQHVESTDIRTTGVYPEVDVRADGSGTTRVQVKLKVGGSASNTFLDLVGPDRLEATFGATTKTLDSTSNGYTATFVGEAGGPYVISFIRGPADISAPNTTVTLPDPFTVTLPLRELSRATDDLTFNWTPPGTADMDEYITGSCIDFIGETIPDDGTATISHDRFHAEHPGDTCTATLSLGRGQTGQVDPAFTEGGRVTANQGREATFTSKP